MALVTEPFVQQMVQYHTCLQPQANGVAFVAKTNFYRDYGDRVDPNTNQPSQEMTLAINAGTVNPASDPASYVSSWCDTGNCVFSSSTKPSANEATYSSVGLCYSCADISDQVQNKTGNYPNFVLPGDPTTLYVNSSYVLTTSWSAGPGSSIGTLRMLYGFPWNYGNPMRNSSTAFSCSLYPCLKTYSGKIINGTLSESVMDSVPIGTNYALHQFETDGLPTWYTAYRVALRQTLRNGTYSKCEASPTNQPGYYPVASENFEHVPANTTRDPNRKIDVSWYPWDCVWSFGDTSASALDFYMGTLFQNQAVQTLGLTGGYTGPLSMMSLCADGDANMSTINSFWKNMTDAMSSVVRAGGINNISEYAYGTAMATVTCANVQWAWISLPAFMVLGVIFFLLTLIFTSPRRGDQPLWKSSALALVFMDLDVRETHGGKKLPTKTELDDVAGKSKVLLRNSDGRPQLS